jgi:hypothetical protein
VSINQIQATVTSITLHSEQERYGFAGAKQYKPSSAR